MGNVCGGSGGGGGEGGGCDALIGPHLMMAESKTAPLRGVGGGEQGGEGAGGALGHGRALKSAFWIGVHKPDMSAFLCAAHFRLLAIRVASSIDNPAITYSKALSA